MSRGGAQLIDSLVGAEALAGEWDELAVAASKPVLAPAWMLGWLRRVAAPSTSPRIIAVRDGGELVGLLPFHVVRRRGLVEYRLMSSDYGVCVEPLALPGREWDVAARAAEALAACRPRPDTVALGPMSVASHWPRALGACWPGPVPGLAHHYSTTGAPLIVLGDRSFEGWFASLSSKMRSNVRRTMRQFEAAGGCWRRSTAATLRADAEAFAGLHLGRWRGGGWSRLAALGDRLPDWVQELGRDLIESGRFRMGVLELDGAPICVDISLLAGDELVAVNLGWDERYARLAPPRIAAVRLVEDARALGARRLHLGRGAMQHKLRLANGNDPVACSVVLVPSVRLAGTCARVLPDLARDRVAAVLRQRLPAPWAEALRSARDLAAGGAGGESSAPAPEPAPSSPVYLPGAPEAGDRRRSARARRDGHTPPRRPTSAGKDRRTAGTRAPTAA
jgi:CelD/BcsL family acetyltransferase involved in cellulose biosynthesis